MTPRRRPQLTLGEIRAAKLEDIIGGVIVAAAVIAAAVSFWQVKWAARLIGIPDYASWGFPIIVDGIGTVLAALTMVMHGQPFRRRLYVWSFFSVLIGISLFCNFLHAVTYVDAHPMELPAALRGATWGIVALLAAIPPCGAAIGMHVYAFTRRHGVVANIRATAAEARAATGAPPTHPAAPPAEPRRTRPAPQPAGAPPAPVNDPRSSEPAAPQPAAHPAAPSAADEPVSAPQVPSGRPASVNTASWRRHWTEIPEFLHGWDAYAALRADGDDDPQPAAIKECALAAGNSISGDRSRVSRWRPLYAARWDAEHPAPDATPEPGTLRDTVNGQAGAAVNGATPDGAPRIEPVAPDVAHADPEPVNGAPVAVP